MGDRPFCLPIRPPGRHREGVSKVEVMNCPALCPTRTCRKSRFPRDALGLFCGPRPLRPYNWRLWLKDERTWQA